GVRYAGPCFCQSRGLLQPDVVLVPGSTPFDASQQVLAKDRAVSGVRAYSHNQRSPHPRLFVNALSTAASTDALTARQRRERIRTKVSYLIAGAARVGLN